MIPGRRTTPSTRHAVLARAVLMISLIGLMWLAEVIDWILGGWLDQFGIRPRQVAGLIGIPLSPFLHVGFGHLIANTVPFAVLGGLAMIGITLGRFVATLVVIVVIGGAGTWLVGAAGFHIGASGVVFGFVGYLLTRGWLERRPVPVLIASAVAIVYGGLLWGVLPVRQGISWEGHLFGFAGGALAAWLFADRTPRPRGGRDSETVGPERRRLAEERRLLGGDA